MITTRVAAQVDSPSTATRRYHLVGYYYTQNSQDHLLSVKAIRFDRLAKSDPFAAIVHRATFARSDKRILDNSARPDKRNSPKRPIFWLLQARLLAAFAPKLPFDRDARRSDRKKNGVPIPPLEMDKEE